MNRPVEILIVVAGGTLLAAALTFLLVPIHVGGADCGTLFTASDDWVSLLAGDPESNDVQVICHNGHTRRLVWVVTLTVLALAALSLPTVRNVRARRSMR